MSDRLGEIRIVVVRVKRMRADIHHIMFLGQPDGQFILQRQAAVVSANRNA